MNDERDDQGDAGSPADEAAAATSGEAAATNAPESRQEFKIQRVYLKDVSFESPQTPGLFVTSANWQPNVSLHLNTESAKVGESLYECVLTVTVTVKLDDTTAYLAEVKQAGLFSIKGLEQKQLGPMLGSYCPNLLFPFARETVASLVQRGGFPQLLLDPVNFELLYARHLERARQNAPAPDTSQ